MAINQNHIVEELEGTRCAIVEKNVAEERAAFLKALLAYNGYTVIVTASAAPKAPARQVSPAAPAAASAAPATTEGDQQAAPPVTPTFTVGVTDLRFNAINAIFGRLLRTPDGHVVTLSYWHQQETVSHDEIPYFQHR